jgi:hypothetical protein
MYSDRKNVYITDREPPIEEQLAGEEPMKKMQVRAVLALLVMLGMAVGWIEAG